MQSASHILFSTTCLTVFDRVTSCLKPALIAAVMLWTMKQHSLSLSPLSFSVLYLYLWCWDNFCLLWCLTYLLSIEPLATDIFLQTFSETVLMSVSHDGLLLYWYVLFFMLLTASGIKLGTFRRLEIQFQLLAVLLKIKCKIHLFDDNQAADFKRRSNVQNMICLLSPVSYCRPDKGHPKMPWNLPHTLSNMYGSHISVCGSEVQIYIPLPLLILEYILIS
jgi:hypothetical protein